MSTGNETKQNESKASPKLKHQHSHGILSALKHKSNVHGRKIVKKLDQYYFYLLGVILFFLPGLALGFVGYGWASDTPTADLARGLGVCFIGLGFLVHRSDTEGWSEQAQIDLLQTIGKIFVVMGCWNFYVVLYGNWQILGLVYMVLNILYVLYLRFRAIGLIPHIHQI